MKKLNQQIVVNYKLEQLRKLSETISVKDLSFLDVEAPDFEKWALESQTIKPNIQFSDLKNLRIKTPPTFLLDYEEFSKDKEIVNQFKKIKQTLYRLQMFSNPELVEPELEKLRDFATQTLGVEKRVSFNREKERLALERIVIELLRPVNQKTIKVYFDFNNEKLTTKPETGDCLMVASITIGSKSGTFSRVISLMNSGKTFKEAFLEKLKFQMKENYVRIYKMDKYSFKDYEKRKVPLALVPDDSIVGSLKSKDLRSLLKILDGRPLSDKERILNIIGSLIIKK